MKKILLFCFLTLLFTSAFAQVIDVVNYRYELELSDLSDTVKGKAIVQVRFKQDINHFVLHLKSMSKKGGMKVYNVSEGGNPIAFIHSHDSLIIKGNNGFTSNAERSFEISYSGVPIDGLIISRNKYGDRTFFSDNWPNRASHWIPCNDVPSDKASVDFIITAPAHYQVISNGMQIEETNIAGNKKRTHWKEEVPIPTKVMVIGAARFSVSKVDTAFHVPITAWVYPQDSKKGTYDYGVAQRILQFFENFIGPYAFKKLANVQSKTIFGGMENASAIFYAENTVSGDRKSEELVAHEIAHQWFGNMATEKNFAHLWLSEGFATYLTNYYWQQQYGNEEFRKRLEEERQQVIQFSRTNIRPVVDSLSPYMDLLNANSYQKGGWVLHMLRNEVGDSAFNNIIRSYYSQYKGNNADTKDFQKVAETVSGKKLDWFFEQWLYRPGIPKLKAEWRYIGDKVVITVLQSGNQSFQFPIEIGYTDENGKAAIYQAMITRPSETFEWELKKKPSQLLLDPNVNMLYVGSIAEVK